ncbi:CvpA family protein [Ruminococcus sp. CLA-AA-H200]|uniref:CvpA family protein n=1 Tax=Ruminococcus turbiniformis TaxID=2881258 RepID=A0ABS8G3S3_9FIRM|nr:CvpA family protein [Ruminococcus turbiniformis]MCC2255569.1 CvpA family protein [Ruminococcus turbiniformis]
MDNWLLIIVAAIFIVCIVVGYVRGFLKLGISLLSTILTLIIVLIFSPYVADALAKYTPVDEVIEDQLVEAFMPEVTGEQLSQIDLSGTPLEGLSAEEIANFSEQDWALLGISADDVLSVIGEIPRDMQIQEIENAPIPQFMKDLLLENNNSTIYGELGVSTFPEYVAAYISRLVLNLLSFLVTFLLAIIIVKALMFAVNIIGELPVLGFINHLCGGVLGLVLAVIIIWIGFLVMTLAYTTEAGSACFEMMEQSSFLRFLYDTNPLLIRLLGF